MRSPSDDVLLTSEDVRHDDTCHPSEISLFSMTYDIVSSAFYDTTYLHDIVTTTVLAVAL